MPYSIEVKEAAKRLFLRRYKAKEIQVQLGLPHIRIVYYWIRQGNWDDLLTDEEPLTACSRRITLLLDKAGTLTKDELSELERLTTLRERLQKQVAKSTPAHVQNGDTAQPGERTRDDGSRKPRREREGKKKEKKAKNDIDHLTEVDFVEKFTSKLFGYQKELFAAKQNPLTARIRNVLKSRQVGATYYFAGEAFMDAVLTGDNQVFLSASRAQSEIFRSYIIGFAKEWFDIELTGDPIVLSNGAKLQFMSTNSSSAQGYSGHVYVDEYFWIRDFAKLNKVASAMATHKKWRKTYFSTPSAVSHPAYPFWTGEAFRNSKKRKKDQSGKEWPADSAYQAGALCPDGQWRKTITILDAIAGGCDLFDLEQLQLEYDDDSFDQLFMCKFIDSTQGAFALKDLEACYSDISLWTDYDPKADRPYGNSPVWIGYDPSRTRDDASCVVVAPPLEQDGKFRILEKYSWRGQSFTYQAEQIQKLVGRFNVQHIGIDTTGIGYGVFDLVKAFFPRVMSIHYSLETKNILVLKAQDTIQKGRIVWDAGMNDISQAFLSIKRGTTGSGQVTYSASRTDATGHADVAWSIMHALHHEPLNVGSRRRSRYALTGQSHHVKAQQSSAGTSGTRAAARPPAAHADIHIRRARTCPTGPDRAVHGRRRHPRRAPVHAAGGQDRLGQAVASQRAPRGNTGVQTQHVAA